MFEEYELIVRTEEMNQANLAEFLLHQGASILKINLYTAVTKKRRLYMKTTSMKQ
jgi:hypothetical protein